jgi:hypothetical protein
VSGRPLVRLAAGAALAAGVGAGCALFVRALDFRAGLCADALVEAPVDAPERSLPPPAPAPDAAARAHAGAALGR